MDTSKNCFIPAELALTSSGDGTAHLWRAVVFCLCFIPAELALTSSGDGTAHLWRAVVSLPSNLELSNKCQSSGEEELDGSEDDNLYDRDVFNDSVPNSNSFSVSANNHAGKREIRRVV